MTHEPLPQAQMSDEKFSSLAHHVIERVKDQDPRVGNFDFDVANKALKSLTETLTHVLHDIDPMGTSCKLNLDMENEYDVEAFHIAVLLNSGAPLHQVICQVFDFWFWEGCLGKRWGEQRLGGLIAQIEESVRYVSSHRDMPALHRMLFENTIPYAGENTCG